MVEYPIGELIAGQVRAMGVTPFYKTFKHDGVRGPEHGDGLQRSRLRRPRPRRLLQPRQRSGGAAQAGRLRLDGDLRRAASAGSTAAASSRRCRETTSELIIEGDAGGEGARRGHVVRPQLPREAVDGRRRRRSRRRGARPHRRARRRAGRQRRGPAEGARHPRPEGAGEVEARSERLRRHDGAASSRASRT